MTKEHLGLALALNVPVFVVVTKIDMCPPNVLQETLKMLQRILKSPGCRKIPVIVQNNDDVVCSATNFTSERSVLIHNTTWFCKYFVLNQYLFCSELIKSWKFWHTLTCIYTFKGYGNLFYDYELNFTGFFCFCRMCPIFQVSNVTGENLDLLKMFLNLLSTRLKSETTAPAEFQIDDTFSVPVCIAYYLRSLAYQIWTMS